MNLDMPRPQQIKPKLSVKKKEIDTAQESQKPPEGLPYASILKGY
jgi:hypothetical protein